MTTAHSSTCACLSFSSVLFGFIIFCLVLFCFILPCLVLFCLVLPCLVLSCSVWFYPVLSCLVQFCLVLSCSILFDSVLFGSVLFGSALFGSVLFGSILFCSVWFYPVWFWPVWLCPVWFYPVWFYPISHFTHVLSLARSHWPGPCPWTPGQFSVRFIVIITWHSEFSPNTPLCQALLLGFRCHHPSVMGTVIMRQVKGRAEIQRIMSEIQSIELTKGGRQSLWWWKEYTDRPKRDASSPVELTDHDCQWPLNSPLTENRCTACVYSQGSVYTENGWRVIFTAIWEAEYSRDKFVTKILRQKYWWQNFKRWINSGEA